ncbi:MAG: hypothetical protein SFT81_06680 [Candidatus Caenarcaniphilales bacterium]|nr:hypothetical protein [Candidatus Caenarcaniphilales bacterium]
MPLDLPPNYISASAYVAYIKSDKQLMIVHAEKDLHPRYLDELPTDNAQKSSDKPSEIEEESSDGIPVLRTSVEDKSSFNSKAIWGPIKARMIPSSKKRLAVAVSDTIRGLSEAEYRNLRYYIEYMARNPASRERVFELTGFSEKDLLFAEKYFRRYESRGLFAKLLEIALSTSSDGNVSRQIGGLVQFIFEVSEIEGKTVNENERYKLVRLMPPVVRPIWGDLASKCPEDKEICMRGSSTPYLDLNDDDIVNFEDIKIARSSLSLISQSPL